MYANISRLIDRQINNLYTFKYFNYKEKKRMKTKKKNGTMNYRRL